MLWTHSLRGGRRRRLAAGAGGRASCWPPPSVTAIAAHRPAATQSTLRKLRAVFASPRGPARTPAVTRQQQRPQSPTHLLPHLWACALRRPATTMAASSSSVSLMSRSDSEAARDALLERRPLTADDGSAAGGGFYTARGADDGHDGHGRDWENAISGNGQLCCPSAVSCLCSTVFFCGWLAGCKTLNEAQGMVFLVNGKLSAVRTEPGLFCVNPCCTKALVVSTMQTTLDLPLSKIVDVRGNPILISAIVNYRINNIVRASLEVQNVNAFVRNAATAILKTTASQYAYETDNASPSLKTHSTEIGREMVEALQRRVTVAGVQIVDMLLNELSYAPEIAGAMLQRQQAEALVDARTLIVHGAVEIARNATQQLHDSGIEMDPAEKARLVANLLCVITGDSKTQASSS